MRQISERRYRKLLKQEALERRYNKLKRKYPNALRDLCQPEQPEKGVVTHSQELTYIGRESFYSN